MTPKASAMPTSPFRSSRKNRVFSDCPGHPEYPQNILYFPPLFGLEGGELDEAGGLGHGVNNVLTRAGTSPITSK
jgi:hypothetical protein